MATNLTSHHNPREVGSSGGLATYDDMQGSISTARVPVANAPTWTNVTLDGFTTQVLAFDTNDYIDIFIQTSHSIQLNQIIDYHVHWLLINEDSGDEFQFQISGVAAGIGEAFTSIGTVKSGDVLLTGSDTGKHNYLDIGEVPALNTTVSTAYIIRLTRIAPDDGNDSAENIGILFSDGHPLWDTMGSLQETSKV